MMSNLRSAVVPRKTPLKLSILRCLSILLLAHGVSCFAPVTRGTRNYSAKPCRSFLARIQDKGGRVQQLFSVGGNRADRKSSKKKSDDSNTANTKKSLAKQGVELVDNLQVKKIRCVLFYLYVQNIPSFQAF